MTFDRTAAIQELCKLVGVMTELDRIHVHFTVSDELILKQTQDRLTEIRNHAIEQLCCDSDYTHSSVAKLVKISSGRVTQLVDKFNRKRLQKSAAQIESSPEKPVQARCSYFSPPENYDDPLHEMSIDDMPCLSVRTIRLLKSSWIYRVGDLVNYPENFITKIYTFGDAAHKEVVAGLWQLGLTLGRHAWEFQYIPQVYIKLRSR